jgi:two-component system, NarL family, sensor kinase
MSTDVHQAVAPPGSPEPHGRRFTWAVKPRHELTVFLSVALLVLLAVGAATVVLSERIARDNALDESKRAAVRLTDLLVAPVLEEALAGMPGRWDELNRLVTNRMSDGSVGQILVWTPDGRILYSSDPELTGRSFPPSDELVRATTRNEVVADLDEAPEAAYEGRARGPMLEVYVPLRAGGQQLAVEAYFASQGIDRQAALLRGEIIPLAIGALVALELVQIPIAVSLARRVRRQETERAQLLQRSLAASERERRAIAADVHDGPVQDLAGVSYALSALKSVVPPERQPTVDRLVTTVRHAVQSLRRLMIDIYPPDLSGPGLVSAIDSCAERVRDQGITATVQSSALPEMSPEAAAVLYRTAKEALSNVTHHAKASTVWISLDEIDHYGGPAVRLEIADDGVGFPDTGTDRRREGHLGLPLVRDRVIDLGGAVDMGNRSGGGAVVTVIVPLDEQL